MGTLTEFLSENAAMPENMFAAISRRFLDKEGKPVKWEIKALTYGEDEQIKRACTKRIAAENRKNDYSSELDRLDYIMQLILHCVVFPNLNDITLQNDYGVMGADNLIRAMLTPGEFLLLTSRVLEINSMLPSFGDELEEARELIEQGDYETEVALYCLRKFNILPSQIMSLPRRERAFVAAAVEQMINNE